MKPGDLVAALIQRSGKTGLQVATEIDGKNFQGTLHRFTTGKSASPQRATVKRIAEYFGIAIDALYDEELAAAEAQRLGIDLTFKASPLAGLDNERPGRPRQPVAPPVAYASGVAEPAVRYESRATAGGWSVASPLFTPAMLASVARLDLHQRQALSRTISAFLEGADPAYTQSGKALSA